jgi:fascin 1/2
MSRKQDLEWSFGLRNSAGKYLTQETFGNKIVCASNKMKKKQIWFLEKTEGQGEVYFRSHLGKYLRVDGDGKFLGDGDDSTKEECGFLIEAQPDGKWALKSQKYGWYAGGSGENLTAFQTHLEADRFWTVNLAMHPLVTIRNVKRQAFVHVNDARDALTTDEIIPWGDDAVLGLEFFESTGTYGVTACTGAYLTNTGALHTEPSEATMFILEFHGGVLAFKSLASGKYVTSLGASGICKATKTTVTNDERYELQNSYPQVTLQSANGLFISIKQGVEVAATAKTGGTDLEIFQLEPLGNSQWTIKGSTDKLWANKDGGIHCVSDPIPGSIDDIDPNEQFTLEWHPDGKVAFKTNTGKYLTQMANKYLKPSADVASEEEKSLFTHTLVNRPRVVLRGSEGFINTLPSGLLECNKSEAEFYDAEYQGGRIAVKGKSGKYWKVGDNGISVVSDTPEFYDMELFPNSKLALKFNGKFFQSAQNGAFTATGSAADAKTLFEY